MTKLDAKYSQKSLSVCSQTKWLSVKGAVAVSWFNFYEKKCRMKDIDHNMNADLKK